MYLAAQIESKNKLGKEDKFFGMTNEEILYNKATLKQMGFLKWFLRLLKMKFKLLKLSLK